MVGNVTSAVDCASMANARAWVNNTGNYTADVPGWAGKPPCWTYGCTATFASPSAGAPTGSPSCDGGEVEPGGSTWAAESYYTPSGSVALSMFLLGDSTAYITGNWCNDGAVTEGVTNTCVMSGTAVGSCYQYVLPVPGAGLCSDNCGDEFGPTEAVYILIPVTDSGGCFGGTWTTYSTFCAANPGAPQCAGFNASPSACLSPDPFFGDDPP
jgi:hypothetical protein